MQNYQPKILIINFAEVDVAGHSRMIGTTILQLLQMQIVLVYELWQIIEAGTYGYTPENTTLFVTNDHGRHAST